ncbi:MAG: Hpt domain-containing protein [Deltaproteobacteria bacterium]|nr:Hpt domain-containing protein [Deltaproteobacteria bacterium]
MDFKIPAQKLGLDLDEYIELIDLFLETGGEDLRGLEDALMNNDIQRMAERSHSLKGASGNLGLVEIYEKAKDIENRSRENNLKGIEIAIEKIKEQIKEIETALEK